MSSKTTRPAPEDVLLVDVVLLMEGNGLVSWRKPWHLPLWRALRTCQWLCLAEGESTLVRAGRADARLKLSLWCGAAQAKQRDCCPKKGSRSDRIVRLQLNKRE